MFLSKNDIHLQSMSAWRAWKSLWIKNCQVTKSLDKVSVKDFVGKGHGKILVQCAFGYSLSQNINTIKKYRDKIDVMCCDKAFGYLMQNGIVPDYCIIADGSVGLEWIKDQDTSQTTLVANVAANPEWTTNWKGQRVFYVNWDNIGSAQILGKIADVYEVIPASSNVSNAQVVFASQVLDHDAQLLVGYDYSWASFGTYYAGEDSDKRYYMRHMDMVSPYGYLAMTSSNLVFSCRWIMQYLYKFSRTNVINCSEQGIMDLHKKDPLDKAIMEETYKTRRTVQCH